MAVIIMADDGITFDGDSLATSPLGGAETAFVSLAEALAVRGHKVNIYNNCGQKMDRAGVSWYPLDRGLPEKADMYIANRGDKLIPLVPSAHTRIFWIHNPAGYLKKWRYFSKLFSLRPIIVFSSNFHVKSLPWWIPCGEKVIIPYGISKVFLETEATISTPAPRAVFTSSPLRSLGWLLDIWATAIQPYVPGSELHVFSGTKTYGEHGMRRVDRIQSVLDKARALSSYGVVLREPIAKRELARELMDFRTLLYRGDPGETYCLAVGEAQAVGVPAIVENIGCVAERIIDGVTGFVAVDDEDFAERARLLLLDDKIWERQRTAAIRHQRSWSWDDAAAGFERFLTI